MVKKRRGKKRGRGERERREERGRGEKGRRVGERGRKEKEKGGNRTRIRYTNTTRGVTFPWEPKPWEREGE